MSGSRGVFWRAIAVITLCASSLLPALAQLDADWAATKQEMIALGKQYDSAWALYQAFEREADDKTLTADEVPDWSGLWERVAPPSRYDPDQQGWVPTAKLKGRYAEMMQKEIDSAEAGRIWDPHAGCGTPRGYPGLLRNGRPHEFAVTRHQTWHITQARNEVRRIYTDGRAHMPEDYAYDTPHGDTIGFWDGDRLITHTKYTDGGWIGRVQPYFSNQLEGTEIWQKVDEATIQADVWLYDSEALEEPWYARQVYEKMEQEEGIPLRLTYWWNCDSANNIVVPTEGGGTTFLDFDFTDIDDQPAGERRQ